MAYTIPNECVQCGLCVPACPTNAIQLDANNNYWVEPGLCNNCEEQNSPPACLSYCPDNLPVPLPQKKVVIKLIYRLCPLSIFLLTVTVILCHRRWSFGRLVIY